MFNKSSFYILALFAFFIPTAHPAITKQHPLAEAKDLLSQVGENIPAIKPEIQRIILQSSNSFSFSQTELNTLLQATLKSGAGFSANDAQKINQAQDIITEYLKKFKVTGWSFAPTFTSGILWATQTPNFKVCYKNNNGEIKTRSYQALLKSFGLKTQCALKFNLIFILGTDHNFYNTDKVIELGSGVEVLAPVVSNILGSVDTSTLPLPYEVKLLLQALLNNFDLEITYVPFKNQPGAFLMVGLPIGVAGFPVYVFLQTFFGRILSKGFGKILRNSCSFTSLSYIRNGGTLTPIA